MSLGFAVQVHVPFKVNGQHALLEFNVMVAAHGSHRNSYTQKLEDFIEKSKHAIRSFDYLAIGSRQKTEQPTQTHTPRSDPLHITANKLGEGACGVVSLILDVSTAIPYARKMVGATDPGLKETLVQEIQIMKNLRHVSNIQ